MVPIVPPLRSIFHPLCDSPAPSVFSPTGTTNTLPRLAPHNPYSNHPVNTTDGCYKNPLVIPGYSPSKRYQPYPQPQCLSPGQLLVFSQQESAKRQGPQSQSLDPRLDGGMPLAPVYVPHPKNDADVMAAARLIPLTAKNYDVEMCDEACVPEADLVDIEMEDDFLPLIVVTPPDDSGQESFVFG